MCNLFEGYPTQDLLLLFVNTLFKVDAASQAQQARLKREWLRSTDLRVFTLSLRRLYLTKLSPIVLDITSSQHKLQTYLALNRPLADYPPTRTNKNLRQTLTMFRRNHSLAVEKGRHKQTWLT